MSTTSWVVNIIKQFQPRRNVNDYSEFDRYQLLMERSSLPTRIQEVCDDFNAQDGQWFIYDFRFTQPHPLVCRYAFERGGKEFRMSLVIHSDGPMLIFSSVNLRPWLPGVLCYLGYQGNREKIVCERQVDPSAVSDGDLQEWFTYLRSGLRRSFKPAKVTARRSNADLVSSKDRC